MDVIITLYILKIFLGVLSYLLFEYISMFSISLNLTKLFLFHCKQQIFILLPLKKCFGSRKVQFDIIVIIAFALI